MSLPLGATSGRLMSVAAASAAIKEGRVLYVAADEAVLRQLPEGMWIGGTIPYFMTAAGGMADTQQAFVTLLPEGCTEAAYARYDVSNIAQICSDAPENGFTLVIVPAFSELHERFAREAPGYEDMYVKPLVGWIAGVHLSTLGSARPQTAFGPTHSLSPNEAVAVHVPLPAGRYPQLQIINLFEQGSGPVIRFTEGGFAAREVLIDGKPGNLARYIDSTKIDTRLPLVADYSGAMINVSIRGVDAANGKVDFYAPVFPELEYRIAKPIPPYSEAFRGVDLSGAGTPVFCCNCILNYLYGELEGKKLDPMHGPMTFGEIAYQLVNQTLVYLSID